VSSPSLSRVDTSVTIEKIGESAEFFYSDFGILDRLAGLPFGPHSKKL
jgi:hypothetical protein